MDLAVFKERAAREGGLDRRDVDVLISEIGSLQASLAKVQNIAKTQMNALPERLRLAREAGRKEAGWCYEESAKAIKAEREGRAQDNADLTAQVMAAENECEKLRAALTRSKAEGRREGLDEAAKICEELAHESFNAVYRGAAAAIRQQAQEGKE